MSDTVALWLAVDSITKPTTRRLIRDEDSDWLSEITQDRDFCDVPTYRASTKSHGLIPSLWEQAEMALYKTGESLDGHRSPLSTRSPADVTLMETMLTIREIIGMQIAGRKLTPRASVPLQIRQLAAHIVTSEPEHLEWWIWRLGHFARLLEVHLQAVVQGPRPMRLRCRCPLCKTEHIPIDGPDGSTDANGKPIQIVVRPLLAVYRDQMFRCFECGACSYSWFAGAGVHQLRDEIEADELSDLEGTMTA